MKCGACKTEGVTVQHVKDCYATPKAAAPVASDFKPMALAPQLVPAGHYAIEVGSELQFFNIKAGTKNPNIRFVDRLIGAPGDWAKIKMSWDQQKALLALILEDEYLDEYSGEDTDGEVIERHLLGAQAAAARFARTHRCCSKCQSPLSDPVSRRRAMGPDCYKNVGWAA